MSDEDLDLAVVVLPAAASPAWPCRVLTLKVTISLVPCWVIVIMKVLESFKTPLRNLHNMKRKD
jgi:hypothetical protein